MSMSLSLLHSLSVWTPRRDTQAAEEKVIKKGQLYMKATRENEPGAHILK